MRLSLSTTGSQAKAFSDVVVCEVKPQNRNPEPSHDERTHRTTGIHLPSDVWELLNRVAFERSKKYDGRASVSALLLGLVQRHRKELEKELKG